MVNHTNTNFRNADTCLKEILEAIPEGKRGPLAYQIIIVTDLLERVEKALSQVRHNIVQVVPFKLDFKVEIERLLYRQDCTAADTQA